jgi:hypothetical protein
MLVRVVDMPMNGATVGFRSPDLQLPLPTTPKRSVAVILYRESISFGKKTVQTLMRNYRYKILNAYM